VNCPFDVESAPNRVKLSKTKQNQALLFFMATNHPQPIVSVAADNPAKTEKDGVKRAKTERNNI
jgi:hypothetical protein